MRANPARHLGLEVDALTPLSMFTFRERSPVGGPTGTHQVLTHCAWLSAELRRAAEVGDADQVRALVACQCMFVDQAAGDRGCLEAAWFLAGLGAPPTHVTFSKLGARRTPPSLPSSTPCGCRRRAST